VVVSLLVSFEDLVDDFDHITFLQVLRLQLFVSLGDRALELLREDENGAERKDDECGKDTSHVFFVDAAHFVFGTDLCCLWLLVRVFVKAAGRQRFNVLAA
jgi:hypothetical protein